MEEKLNGLLNQLAEELTTITKEHDLNELKSKYLGKKSEMANIYNDLKNMDVSMKKSVGQLLNQFKNKASELIDAKKSELDEQLLNAKLQAESIDITLPSLNRSIGSAHPVQKIISDFEELFTSMGYDIALGPEVESVEYNFDMLNEEITHPARGEQDTFYINEDTVLRTHTSPVQVRTMLANKDKKAIRVACPGKVYRRDTDDATHSHQFNQLEVLVVDKNITIANLKDTLEITMRHVFGNDREIRFRPNNFPFTEPSYEVDVTCFNCNHDPKCSICKGTGWIELLGSGMVHPNVLRMSGYDPEIYSGFAFGVGIERITMLKYGITDIRDIYTNDLRFLKQFNQIEVQNENK